MKKILSVIISGFICLSSFMPFLTVVNAEGENWESEYLYRINKPTGNYYWRAILNGQNYLCTVTGTVGSQNANASVSSTPVYIVRVMPYNDTQYIALAYYYEDEVLLNESNIYLRSLKSLDGLNYTNLGGGAINSTYTYNNNSVVGRTVKYRSQQGGLNTLPDAIYYANDLPTIQLQQNQDINTVLAAISINSNAPFPWTGTTNDGTLQFPDGVTLSPENNIRFQQVYTVMDINHDNSVTEEEVNYYNVTYNTNYDYNEINNGDNFTELQFLYWVATKLMNGDDPGGEPDTPGGGGAISGGITVTDSFTQSQTQTQSIAENAVNVTVNNDGSVNNENVQWIDSIINNTVMNPDDANAFEHAMQTMGTATYMAREFSLLAAEVLNFLPGWIVTLIGLLFTVLLVMVVFRLIHLFV